MGKHSTHRTLKVGAAALAAGLLAASLLALTRDHPESDGDRAAGTAQGRGDGAGRAVACPRVLRAVTATSFAPVLAAVAPTLGRGENCVAITTDVADGRAAADRVRRGDVDVWIPDDGSWASVPPKERLAGKGTAGAGTVLATSPLFLVTDRPTAARLERAGGSWRGLAGLLAPRTGVKLVVRDPGGSGDGLLGAGAVGEAVWIADGMDASALALATVQQVTRTVPAPAPALPAKAGEVGVIAEYALLPMLARVPEDAAVLAPTDHTALLRYTWLPSADAAGDPVRAAGLSRLLAALTAPSAGPALTAAKLRPPTTAATPELTADRIPPMAAKPFDVLRSHHVDHVFTTWYAADRRTNLLIVVDVSGSMAEPVPGTGTPLIKLVGDACRTVGTLLPDNSRLGLWEFGSRLAPPRDHRPLLAPAPMDQRHRAALTRVTGALTARPTGTGLYDTILAAYTAAVAGHQRGVPSQVLLFTDGRNEDDPGSISAAQLRAGLDAAAKKDRPVQLSVVAFGSAPEVGALEAALKPVDGYVASVDDPALVAATFVHVAAGGLHG
jgi:hypothetical protein